MTEKEYFQFIEQYLQLFAAQIPPRKKIEMDPKKVKL